MPFGDMIEWRQRWSRAGRFGYDDTDRAEVGERSFHMERIPAPPEARPVLRRDPVYGYEMIVGCEVRHACPNCLKPVTMQWSRTVTEDFAVTMREAGILDPTGAYVAFAAIDAMKDAQSSAALALQRAAEQQGRADRAEQDVRKLRIRLAKAQGKKRRWRKRGRR